MKKKDEFVPYEILKCTTKKCKCPVFAIFALDYWCKKDLKRIIKLHAERIICY